jgi:moderate conductance mechanosensitive channel
MQSLLGNYELSTVLEHAIRIAVILAGAYIATRIIMRVVPRIRTHLVERMIKETGPDIELEKRAATLGGIFRRTAKAVVWILAVVMVLRETGFDIGPILAGAGILGLAVGFGAQNLVRDVISGMFLLIEDQVRVNDVAVINGTGGLVEALNLRTTVLRGLDGTVHVFPNGSITTLSNMTHGYSYYVFDVGVAYKEDTDRVVSVLKEIAAAMMKEEQFRPLILEPLEVLGVDKFADSAVVIKTRIKTVPIKQWVVGREMNRRIKKRFDELGIEIPFPHLSLYFGEASKPIKIGVQDSDREELKELIREVLEERSRPQHR